MRKTAKRYLNMSKVAVVYWSGTGNTQMMAEKVAEGVRAAGAEADVYNCTEFSADLMDNYEAVAFGCPSMGSEQLEDTEFEPVFTECEAKLSGKVKFSKIQNLSQCLTDAKMP